MTEGISYTISQCLKLVKKPWLIDIRFWRDEWATRQIPFALRAQMHNAMVREAKLQWKKRNEQLANRTD